MELESKKSAEFPSGTEGEKGTNNSKIPRPPLAASFWFNETLKSNQTKGENKKPPSMIPRSKSRKRKENDKVKFVIPSETESPKSQSNLAPVSSKNQSIGNLLTQEPPDGKPTESIVLKELEEKNLGQKLLKRSLLSLKSCRDFGEVSKADSDMSYKDALYETVSGCRTNERKELETAGHEETDAVRQERTIKNLYETTKYTFGPAFDLKPPTEAPDPEEHDGGSEPVRASIQGQYDFTLKEIANIWRNTIGFIGSVRDHTVKFVEENSKMVDKEQLILEAEMMQLALDFAISYSKLKTDFLIQSVRKRVNAEDAEKSELETFMDSKTFGALYSNEDLSAMARTVQDLNRSLLDLELLE